MDEMDKIDLPEDLRNHVVLEFGRVIQSPYYSRVIELAQHMSTYQIIGEGRNEKHFVALAESESEQWLDLYDIVQNWKSSRVHYGNLNASPKHRLGIFQCYLTRSKSDDTERYCFNNNWIGCRRIHEGHALELFIKTGRFLNKVEFEPDKESIRNRVTEGIGEYGLCPAFDFARIEEKINELPLIINLNADENWQPIIESDNHGEGGRLIGIQYNIDRVLKDAPIIDDVDELDAFSVRRRGFLHEYDEAWEHKIVILSSEQYDEGAKNGILPEIAKLGLKGWLLITIVPKESEWHFILQRRRPY